jgi:hypothetical protein
MLPPENNFGKPVAPTTAVPPAGVSRILPTEKKSGCSSGPENGSMPSIPATVCLFPALATAAKLI